MAAGNYAQAAVIRSNMHFDVAESTIGVVAGGMGAYRAASRVGSVVATQGSRALLWRGQHSGHSPLPYGKKQIPLKHKFINEFELIKHFKKHGSEFKGAYRNPEEYLHGANFVIEHGHKVKYQYMGQERIGYVRFMGNARNLTIDEMLNNLSKRELGMAKDHKFGEAKFEFLALRNDGTIATYHTQSTENFCKTLNQNKNADTINVENLSCRMM